MKSNAREYLEDVGFKRIDKIFSLAGRICKSMDLNDLLSKKEKVSIKIKNGFTVQAVDRREQYERRKQKAENIGMGFK